MHLGYGTGTCVAHFATMCCGNTKMNWKNAILSWFDGLKDTHLDSECWEDVCPVVLWGVRGVSQLYNTCAFKKTTGPESVFGDRDSSALPYLKVDITLAVNCLAQRRSGRGCLVSTVSLRCSSSSLCPCCQSLPASCCWSEGTARPLRKVWESFFKSWRIHFTNRFNLVACWLTSSQSKPPTSLVLFSFEEAMGRQGLQQGGGGDVGGEGCPAERPQPLSVGADSEPNVSLAAPHYHCCLFCGAALWHQYCELFVTLNINFCRRSTYANGTWGTVESSIWTDSVYVLCTDLNWWLRLLCMPKAWTF